jgi:hypothetical protein
MGKPEHVCKWSGKTWKNPNFVSKMRHQSQRSIVNMSPKEQFHIPVHSSHWPNPGQNQGGPIDCAPNSKVHYVFNPLQWMSCDLQCAANSSNMSPRLSTTSLNQGQFTSQNVINHCNIKHPRDTMV